MKVATSDMIHGYRSALGESFPEAVVTVDKFHVVKNCSDAVEILNYFQTLRTNAILEGFNSKISIIKSRARGFRNMRDFMNMIYFVCGELSLPLQPIM